MEQSDQSVHQNYSLGDNLQFVIGVIHKHSRIIIPVILLQAVLQAIMPFVLVFLAKTVVDFFTQAPVIYTDLLQILCISILILWLCRVLSNASGHWLAMQANFSRHYLMQLIQEKTMTMDYIKIESPLGQRARRLATRAVNSNNSGGEALVVHFGALLQHTCCLILYGFFMFALNIWLLLALVAAALLSAWLMRKAQLYEVEHKDKISFPEQNLNYLREQANKSEKAKDIRIYNMEPWFQEYLKQFLEQALIWKRKTQSRYFSVDAIGALLISARDGLAYFYLLNMVLKGLFTPGEFTFYFAAIASISNWLNQISSDLGLINKASIDIGYLRSFLDIPDTPLVNEGEKLEIIDPKSVPEIVFENVSFRYPGTDKWTLQHINLKIRAGEKLAIVGMNGAGKTTLVKLLTGLYQPSEGRILINNMDTASIQRSDYFKLFAIVFQEIRVLAFNVQQNVALQTTDKIDSLQVDKALDQAGLTHVVSALPLKTNTPLTRTLVDEGVTLSGGQAQKLMLARALYKDAPIVILDEPTSALDPLAEAQLYEDYSEIISGKTAIFISHRLASTRFCDRIVLIKDKMIHENGNHQELLALGGEYARIFDLQARYYRENSEEGDADG